MTELSLLPKNETPFEACFSRATSYFVALDDPVSSIAGLKLVNPPPSFLPYLIYEYGLGELTPYVPNLYDLIEEGIAWQRVRGTHAAVAKALGWLTYAAGIEEAATRRRYWNLFQLALDRLRDDEADLPRIEGVAGLSAPLRSIFVRGYHGYDVRPLEWAYSRWGATMWSASSGAVLPGGFAKWSFGRRHDIAYDITLDDFDALGIDYDHGLYFEDEPVYFEDERGVFEDESGRLRWRHVAWPHVPWESDAATARAIAQIVATGGGPAWAVFKDADGEVLLFRRCRVRRQVAVSPDGVYRNGTLRYAADGGGTMLYLEAMTDFGDGYETEAASVGFVLTAQPAAPHKPGAAVLPPDGFDTPPPVIAETPLPIVFGRTVRERVTAVLRF